MKFSAQYVSNVIVPPFLSWLIENVGPAETCEAIETNNRVYGTYGRWIGLGWKVKWAGNDSGAGLQFFDVEVDDEAAGLLFLLRWGQKCH